MKTTHTQEFKAGWAMRLADANAKLPRSCKKNEEFINGFWACNTACMQAICEGIRNSRNPVYPSAL